MDEIGNLKNKINIRDINSSFIIKNIFSFLSKEQKLSIIIYNKDLQKKLNINIEDYKIVEGIYKVGDRNGKGKEYDEYGNLIFEGEYLKGKRNGKEYYYDSKLKFEGEYLKEKRNGKGKEYYHYGKLKFEGEYKWRKMEWKRI